MNLLVWPNPLWNAVNPSVYVHASGVTDIYGNTITTPTFTGSAIVTFSGLKLSPVHVSIENGGSEVLKLGAFVQNSQMVADQPSILQASVNLEASRCIEYDRIGELPIEGTDLRYSIVSDTMYMR